MNKFRKEVLFIIDSLGYGGAEKSLVSLLPLLDRNKYSLSLWVRSRGGAFESLLPDDITIVDEPHYNIVAKILFKMGGLGYSFISRIYRYLGKRIHPSELLWKCQGKFTKVPAGNFDVVVAYHQGIPTYLVATKFQNAKKLAWINADIEKAGYNREFNSYFYRKYDKICAVSKELYKMLQHWLPEFSDKYACVYDILNPLMIRDLSKKPIWEPDYNSKLCILTVGRLALPKNHLLAVRTANVLRSKGLDFCWFFVGDGGQRTVIEEEISSLSLQDYIRILGSKANPYSYIDKCDIYVQTSSFEGFGLSIAEAKILGKPIVSTNFDVVYDQLAHGVNGLIAEMNEDSIASAIIEICNDEMLRKRLGNTAGKEINNTYFSEVKKVESLIDGDQS